MPALIILHVTVCLLLAFIVLMQRPRSEGLGAAFGGGMTDNLFGPQTTNVLSKFTVVLGIVFFVLTLGLSILTAKSNSGTTPIQERIQSLPIPTEAAKPAGTPTLASPELPTLPAPATTTLPEASTEPAPQTAPSPAR